MQLQRSVAVLAFIASLGFTWDAQAELELGLRTGYGIPLGKGSDDATEDLNEAIAGQVPLWLDLGGRIDQRFYLGGYLAYGIGIPGSTLQDQCDAAQGTNGFEVSCAAHDWRFGAQFHYHIGEPQNLHPWVGAGIGYEVVGWSVTAERGSDEATMSVGSGGWEFFNLQAGLDIPVSDVVALGPFATFTVAQYEDFTLDCSGNCAGFQSQDRSLENKSLHNWLLFGVRATFLLSAR